MLFRSKYLDPSRDVIDIGANIGFFSVLAGRRLSTGRVLSVEPTDAAFARLSRNVQLHGVSDRAILHQGLISDTQGTKPFPFIPGLEEYSSLGSLHPAARAEDGVQEHTVASDRLNDLV